MVVTASGGETRDPDGDCRIGPHDGLHQQRDKRNPPKPVVNLVGNRYHDGGDEQAHRHQEPRAVL
jgi:hypothetical protein